MTNNSTKKTVRKVSVRERVSCKSLSIDKSEVTSREEGYGGEEQCQNVDGIAFLCLGQ